MKNFIITIVTNVHRIAVMALLLALPISAHPQDTPEITRTGIVFGAAIGGGAQFLGGETFGRLTIPNLKLGAMINHRVAILLYAPGGSSVVDGEERAFEGFFPTAQYWFTDRFYVNAGVGLAIETTPFYRVDFAQGPPAFNGGMGLTVSAGYEVLQWSTNKTLDVQARVLFGNIAYQDQSQRNHLAADLLVGFNLF